MPKVAPDVLAARRKAILGAALRCFLRKGYRNTSIADIMRESGFSKGGIYHHFRSKAEILIALFDQQQEDKTESLTALLTSQASAAEKLLEAAEVLWKMINDFPEMRKRLLMDLWWVMEHEPQAQVLLQGSYEKYRGVICQILQEGIEKGEFRSVDKEAFATVFLAIFDGLFVQKLSGEIPAWGRIKATLQDTMLRGLRAGEANWGILVTNMAKRRNNYEH